MKKDCKTEGCNNQIEEKYMYCWDCMEEKKKNPTMIKQRKTATATTPIQPTSKVEELLTNINIGTWRLVNYKEAEMIKEGIDPKKVRDDMWKQSQEDDEVARGN